ncbi:MAG: SMI1/KNR4 family protein [Chloroflexota bacterium]
MLHYWHSVLDRWLPTQGAGGGSRRDGASAEQLAAAETRLGVSLPRSYRTFLQATNDCLTGSDFVYELWPAEGIDWFQKLNPQWVEACTGPHLPDGPTVSDDKYFDYGASQDPAYLRVEYLTTALQISPRGDSAVYLLNPQVVTEDGAWEAWFFANWLPGATGYRSFVEMILKEYKLA